MKRKLLVVGAGFAGATLARSLAEQGSHITIIEKRSHVGGNCFSYKDPKTGIMVHKYGPHIFHTSRKDVWDFVRRFGSFGNYIHKVYSVTDKGIFSLPINLFTINQYFQKNLSPDEAKSFIDGLSIKTKRKNFEEQALYLMGQELYNSFFKYYSKKQWGTDPKMLPASILKRLPIRFNYNQNYFNDIYQGIPIDGYGDLITKMLDHKNIDLHLNTEFNKNSIGSYDHVFYTGPLDMFFSYKFGLLGYRTLEFQTLVLDKDLQGTSVINYCSDNYSFTRITEYKYFTPWADPVEKTICHKEISKAADKDSIPYYPLRLSMDMDLLKKYVDLAENEDNITFLGRLGTYRYLNMDAVIGESLDVVNYYIDNNNIPTFFVDPVSESQNINVDNINKAS